MIKLIFKLIALAAPALSLSDLEFNAALLPHGVDPFDVMPIMDAVANGNLTEVERLICIVEVMVGVVRSGDDRVEGLLSWLVFSVLATVDDEIIAKVVGPVSKKPEANYKSTLDYTSRKCGGSHGTPSNLRTSSSVRGTGVPGCVSWGTSFGDDASAGTVIRQCADSEQPILFA